MSAAQIKAPMANELSDRLDWLNVSGVRLEALKGRVVALAFWHAGSTTCANLLDDLQLLQRKHADGLTVVGIHCPKFDAERERDVVISSLARLGIRIPVAADPDFIAWQHYGVRGWPCTVLIDTHGRVRQQFAGDLRHAELDAAVEALLHEGGEDDSRVFGTLQLASRLEARQPLSFPSGLAVTDAHVYVADSGHHRILECTHEGRVLRQFGSGTPGLLDGGSADAGFLFPCGLSLHREALYVADRGNHALRRIRLLSGDVETVLGNGRPGPAAADGDLDADVALNAPGDVTAINDRLFIAMTGANQVWEYDLTQRRLRVLAGSGNAGIDDGVGSYARFAEPAGLVQVQQTLYVVDAASSALRSVHAGDGAVQTLLGRGLFEFGNEDGARAVALLQQPLALALEPGSPRLWIADAYNNAIRSLRLGGGDVQTQALDYRLHRPAALASRKGVLWIANSDAHELLALQIDSGNVRRIAVGE
ncbi:MAG: redoxin family protein [Xanthomonadales bacterium]|nr:redoxin family protein [Xanthomonadales bacterium]